METDPYIIAEIGGTHIGNLDRAKKLALLAKLSGAHALKTQKRNPIESVPKEIQNEPHPNEMFSYGKTYLEHRLNLELDIEEHKFLKNYCEEIDITYSTSVWDMTSTHEVIELNPEFIKIPSAMNHHKKMLETLIKDYAGDIHLSLGMTTKDERKQIYKIVKKNPRRFVIYHCTSGYPVPFEQLYLKEIKILCDELASKGTRIGFSNHGKGIATEPAAYVLGATYFERHFIDDRTFLHSDAACSLEPQGLHKLCRDLKCVQRSLSYKPYTMDALELTQRKKLRN
tara:strand:- start:170 stop:1021 length:852 start_codon:yes stop_codon:yes gene_type:complete